MLHLNRQEALRYLEACPPGIGPGGSLDRRRATSRRGDRAGVVRRQLGGRRATVSEREGKAHRLPEGRPPPHRLPAHLPRRDPARAPLASGSRRLAPLPPGLHQPPGLRLNRDNVRRRGHGPAVKAAGSPSPRLHDLRHTAATLWLAAGESIYFVQQQLGHADIQTTIDLYGHPDREAIGRPPRGRRMVARRGLGIVLGTSGGTTTRFRFPRKSAAAVSDADFAALAAGTDPSALNRVRPSEPHLSCSIRSSSPPGRPTRAEPPGAGGPRRRALGLQRLVSPRLRPSPVTAARYGVPPSRKRAVYGCATCPNGRRSGASR